MRLKIKALIQGQLKEHENLGEDLDRKMGYHERWQHIGSLVCFEEYVLWTEI